MIMCFATKRDINGNRYFLGIDTDKKIFARTSAHWYGREDIVEVTKTDRRKMIDKLDADGYTEQDYI